MRSTKIIPDRRRAARVKVCRPVKLQCTATGKYYRGRTKDLSIDGVWLEADHPSGFAVGQTVRVGIAWSDRHSVLNASGMPHGTVVRCLGLGAQQHLAVHFQHPQVLAATA